MPQGFTFKRGPSPMMRKLNPVCVTVFFLLWLASANASPIYVDPSGKGPGGVFAYTTIQAGVNAASAGTTIIVDPGTYNENVTINMAGLILQGAEAGVNPVHGRN